jgi:hypothetical protein
MAELETDSTDLADDDHGPFVVYAVVNNEQTSPDEITFDTRAQMNAWLDGFEYAGGWLNPMTFDSRAEAEEYTAENLASDDEDESDSRD